MNQRGGVWRVSVRGRAQEPRLAAGGWFCAEVGLPAGALAPRRALRDKRRSEAVKKQGRQCCLAERSGGELGQVGWTEDREARQGEFPCT